MFENDLRRYVIGDNVILLIYNSYIITVKEDKDVKEVTRWIKEAKAINADPCSYINYMIHETW